jgi:hypothetical protein
VLIALLVSVSTFVLAKTQEKSFDLRQSPKLEDKIIATLPQGTPIMPIIRQNGWVKVADPKTGTVGWVRSDKIEQSPVVITQVIAGGSNYCKDNNCQFSFYSSSKPLTSGENDALWQRIHAQEQYLLSQQVAMQKQMNQFMSDLNTLMIHSTTIGSSDVAALPSKQTNSTVASKANQQPNDKQTSNKPFWKFWKKEEK